MATQVSTRGPANTPRVPETSAAKQPRIPAVLLKFVIAVSAIILVGYLIVHMIGNLQIFWGETRINDYAVWLRTLLAPVLGHEGLVWAVRVILLAAVIGHIWASTVLALRARKTSGGKYAAGNKVKGSYTTHTMRYGGVIILLFVIYHLLDLTTGTLNPVGEHLDVWANVHADFAPGRWYVTLFYVLALVLLFFHLRHGLWSATQTLGWSSNRSAPILKGLATAFSAVLIIGFLIVPVSVTFGWI